MIRMGEVLEQGFYGVTPNPKKAAFYFNEGRRILSLLAAQGMPQAALTLGHVYIEGLGTKQDIPRAERYFKFAEEKAQYTDREYWFWKHYGITLRQVTVPENIKKIFKEYNSKNRNYFNLPANYHTCLLLIREGFYVPQFGYHEFNNCDMTTDQFFWGFELNRNGTIRKFYNKDYWHNDDNDSSDAIGGRSRLNFHIIRNGKFDQLIFKYR